MSHYIFPPAPTFGRSEHPFVTWNEGFSNQELENIIAIGNSRIVSTAMLDTGTVNSSVRIAETSWIENSSESSWLYDRLAYIVQQLNGQFYGFDLQGFNEHFQYTVYTGNEEQKGHYTWHQDSGSSTGSPRKLSLVLQLSDPETYEGGDLQIMTGSEPITVDKGFGKLAAFPAYTLHQVTPVTRGVRRTLVIWTTGPAFR